MNGSNPNRNVNIAAQTPDSDIHKENIPVDGGVLGSGVFNDPYQVGNHYEWWHQDLNSNWWYLVKFNSPPENRGVVIGTESENFSVATGVNDALKLKGDGGSSQTVTLTAGAVRTAAQVASDINDQTTGITASDSGGRVRIQSDTLGSSSSLEIETVANDAYTTLGLKVETVDNEQGAKNQAVGYKVMATITDVSN